MSGLRLARPWLPLTTSVIDSLPAQLGVYEIGDTDGCVVKIGYAGGRTKFGMRSALRAECDAATGTSFRHEFTHGYLTRYEELLMVFLAEHGVVPPGNDAQSVVGRLHLDASTKHREA